MSTRAIRSARAFPRPGHLWEPSWRPFPQHLRPSLGGCGCGGSATAQPARQLAPRRGGLGLWDPRTFNVAYPEPRNAIDPYSNGYNTLGAPAFSGLGAEAIGFQQSLTAATSLYVTDPCVQIPRPAGCGIRGYRILTAQQIIDAVVQRRASLRLDGWAREPGVAGTVGIFGLYLDGVSKVAIPAPALIQTGLVRPDDPGLLALSGVTPAQAAAQRASIEQSQQASLADQRGADTRIAEKYSFMNLVRDEWRGLTTAAKTVSLFAVAGLVGGVYLLFKHTAVSADVGLGPIRIRSK